MTAAQQKLAADHIKLAHDVAANMTKRGMTFDDCYASALAGLCQAAMSWRADGGASFTTYSQHRMRGKILDDLRERDYLSRNHRKSQPDHSVGSLSTPIHTGSGREKCVSDTLAAKPAENLDGFASIVAKLSTREERVMFVLYYQEGMSMREVGEAVGVTQSRVSQVMGEATRRLRSNLTLAIEYSQFAACPGAACSSRSAKRSRPYRRRAPKPQAQSG